MYGTKRDKFNQHNTVGINKKFTSYLCSMIGSVIENGLSHWSKSEALDKIGGSIITIVHASPTGLA